MLFCLVSLSRLILAEILVIGLVDRVDLRKGPEQLCYLVFVSRISPGDEEADNAEDNPLGLRGVGKKLLQELDLSCNDLLERLFGCGALQAADEPVVVEPRALVVRADVERGVKELQLGLERVRKALAAAGAVQLLHEEAALVICRVVGEVILDLLGGVIELLLVPLLLVRCWELLYHKTSVVPAVDLN